MHQTLKSMAGLSFIKSDTRRRLLLLIKHRGSVSLDEAMKATGMSRTNMREHLGQLERDGLVRRSTNKASGRGRPSHQYGLSKEAARLFPSLEDNMFGQMLDYLQNRGDDELIAEFFEQYWNAREREVREAMKDGDPLEVLEELLREQGFMPEIEQGEDGLVIRECNCPFPEAVRRTRLPCKLEARFFERVLDKRTTRVSHIPDGSPACTYELS